MESCRMNPNELRGFEGFENISDKKAELIFDGLIAFAWMILLEVVK